MSSDTAYRRLHGAKDLKARKLYRALVTHHKQAYCPFCDSYPKYGSLIIKGDLFAHLGDITGYSVNPADLFRLQEAKLISLEQVTPNRHRIMFVTVQEEPA